MLNDASEPAEKKPLSEDMLQSLPDIMAKNASLMKESLMKAVELSGLKDQSKSEDKPTANTTPEKSARGENAQLESKIENSNPTEITHPDQQVAPTESSIPVDAVNPVEPAKPQDIENKDNPKIEEEEEQIITTTNPNKAEEDEEEEEIITTNPNKTKKKLPEEEEDKVAQEDNDDDDEYGKDQFRAPWENLEVASTIFEKTKNMQENAEEFENNNWNLKADILERQADLEVLREAIQDGIQLYQQLIALCVKHNCDRQKSRTIAGVLYKVGCAYSLMDTGFQAAIDNFHEAADILSLVFIEEVKKYDPELASTLSVQDLKNRQKLQSVEIQNDLSRELQGIIVEITHKIEEVSSSLADKDALDIVKKQQEKPNTFKKPVFEDTKPMDLGTFGKGKKRTRENQESADKAINEAQMDSKTPAVVEEATEATAKVADENCDIHKRQKTDEN